MIFAAIYSPASTPVLSSAIVPAPVIGPPIKPTPVSTLVTVPELPLLLIASQEPAT